MSYRCGLGPGMASIGVTPCEPHISCDGCGVQRPIVNPNARNLMPPKWFFAKRPPPGWKGLRTHNGEKRWDLCPLCWTVPVKAENSERHD